MVCAVYIACVRIPMGERCLMIYNYVDSSKIWVHFTSYFSLALLTNRLILGIECSVNGRKRLMKQKIPFTSNVLQMPSLLEFVVCLILV